jgi:hypothetical protein
MASLLNKAQVRRCLLETMQRRGRAQFVRVSAEYYRELEGRVRAMIEDDAHRHPSMGVTVKALGYA